VTDIAGVPGIEVSVKASGAVTVTLPVVFTLTSYPVDGEVGPEGSTGSDEI
jgi:hypothetical protein